jgi:tRNA pseudouridine65 synthase
VLAFRLIRESESWLALDKPAGFHTHPPEDKSIRLNPRWNALAIAERQFRRKLFPVHRLDRATSGLLLFSKVREANHLLQDQFAGSKVEKNYFVLVRGEFRGEELIERPLRNEAGVEQAASTLCSGIFSFPLPIPHPDGSDRRFTVLSAKPLTGRYHQIRRHLANPGFPIVGDNGHGDRRLNRLFSSLSGFDTLCLRSMAIAFDDPDSGTRLRLQAGWNRQWHRIFELAGCCVLRG